MMCHRVAYLFDNMQQFSVSRILLQCNIRRREAVVVEQLENILQISPIVGIIGSIRLLLLIFHWDISACVDALCSYPAISSHK